MGAHPLAQGISASVGEVSAAESKIAGIRVFSIVSGQNQNPYMIIQIDVLTTIPCAMLVSDLHVFSTVRVVVVVVYLLYAGGVLFRRADGGCCGGGIPRAGHGSRCDCAERPAGLWGTVSSCFVPEGSGGIARGLWGCAGWRWPSLSDRDGRGGYRRITVASAIRAIEAEAEQHNHVVSVMPGVDVCLDCQWRMTRGSALPMVYCQ